MVLLVACVHQVATVLKVSLLLFTVHLALSTLHLEDQVYLTVKHVQLEITALLLDNQVYRMFVHLTMRVQQVPVLYQTRHSVDLGGIVQAVMKLESPVKLARTKISEVNQPARLVL